MASWLVLGCGYTGTALARELVRRGETVTITKRDVAVAAKLGDELGGVRGVRVDLGEPATLGGLIARDTIAVCLAPPGAAPAAEIHALVDAAGDAKIVYVSSTGVYAPGGGAMVDEGWPLAPTTKSGRARVEAEVALSNAPRWIVLRAAGIYGPGRGLIERIRAGTMRIVGDGTSHVSRIHVDDLVSAIIAAGTREVGGYINVADDDPAPIGEVADAFAASLGVPPPPRISPSAVDPEIAGMLTADRRISNTRMKTELGVVLAHPSVRT
jgi:nucleoside-diphosphate-sugar epimerase